MDYSASVSSRMYIDRSGTRVEHMDVKVDGFKDDQALSDATSDYNRGEEIADRWERTHEGVRPAGSPELRPEDWRYRLWWTLYAGMLNNLRRWRRRHA